MWEFQSHFLAEVLKVRRDDWKLGQRVNTGENCSLKETPEQKRDFLKKIGSDLQVREKELGVTFKSPWQFVAEFNSTRASARADNEFSLTGVNWRRGRDSNPFPPERLSRSNGADLVDG